MPVAGALLIVSQIIQIIFFSLGSVIYIYQLYDLSDNSESEITETPKEEEKKFL
tara:strand:- start:427 stop:588 length:162 start_codon:yes stop_codon:yes gene_type:complete